MTTGHLEDNQLQQYFDGELPDAEAEPVRLRLESSEGEQARLESLNQLRSLIRMAADESAAEVSGEDLFAGVKAGIDRQAEEGFGGGLTVVEGEGRPIEKWKVWVPVASSFAAAAAVLLLVLRPGAPPPTTLTEPAMVENLDPSVMVVEPPHGSEVVEVDFGQNVGTVFEVEGDAGEPIAVVWINDEPL